MAVILDKPVLLYDGPEWDFDKLKRVHDAIEVIARKELGLDVYPTQIEVITSEQMLDAYASVGLPLMYRHWSFGKHFAREEALYRHGYQGLAYEIVINSSPCISYIMEENSMAMPSDLLGAIGRASRFCPGRVPNAATPHVRLESECKPGPLPPAAVGRSTGRR